MSRCSTRLGAIANDVADFADKEASLSQLPGLNQGPGDAYRHLVGVAELSRRLGPLRAYAIAEGNEQRSFLAMLRSVATGQPVASSNTLAAGRMDRHNNKLALWIGATSDLPEEVVARARGLMERAIASRAGRGTGTGRTGRPRAGGQAAAPSPTGPRAIGRSWTAATISAPITTPWPPGARRRDARPAAAPCRSARISATATPSPAIRGRRPRADRLAPSDRGSKC